MQAAFYVLAFLVAVAISASAVYALYWSSKHGQLRDFERDAASIFDDEEPVGRTTDHFPVKRAKPRTLNSKSQTLNPKP
jgi:cbb3-type cytochrome oxidase maturation protein